ncbi:MAG: hypothetical protein SCH71_10560 [Desulfobulbaceae bacterium]|nr:hypothetical protein [Desulfobulbaceae bacterium]
MFVNRTLCFAIIFLSGAVILCPVISAARQTTVIGSLGLSYDFWDRSYDDGDENLIVDQNEGDRSEWAAWPEIELRSEGIHDLLSLRYTPVLKYDNLNESTDVDHYLALAGERSLSRNWTVSMSDDFVMSDDPYRYETIFYSPARIETPAEEEVQPARDLEAPVNELTRNLGRRSYWTNNFALQTEYTYAQDSDIGVGYGYGVLRNRSDDEVVTVEYDEYDRHEFSGLWSHRINPQWRTNLNAGYIEGLYDDREDPDVPQNLSQDLQEYRADFQVAFDRSSTDSFPLRYGFRGIEYEDLRQDIWAHQFTAGWDHAFDSRNRLKVGAGPSYINAEDLDGEWGYSAYMIFNRAYQHADFNARVNKRYEPQNFTGSEDTGLTDIVDAGLDLTYQFTKNLNTTVFALYRYEDILDPRGAYFLSALGQGDPQSEQEVSDITYSRDSYSTGASLNYTFWRWFVATARYVYYQQDGDLLQDSYTDHRIMFLISASKTLLRN